jgi:hypothetical protein
MRGMEGFFALIHCFHPCKYPFYIILKELNLSYFILQKLSLNATTINFNAFVNQSN